MLARVKDNHVFPPAAIDKIVEQLAALDQLGAGVTRYGAELAEYRTIYYRFSHLAAPTKHSYLWPLRASTCIISLEHPARRKTKLR